MTIEELTTRLAEVEADLQRERAAHAETRRQLHALQQSVGSVPSARHPDDLD